ncbi:MAG: DNA photolyase, partial [Deltaproteobacteria bacterium]|nr:DNA photolyase [Deltaproteobacteria bacterium]MBW2324761.1 DNA photolyase [Deltaproteobacteria bacterium]
MKYRSSKPRLLVVEEESRDSALAKSLKNQLPMVKVVPSVKPADYANYDAETLILAEHRGTFVKPCPGTRGYNCCGLKIIHFGLGC